MVYSYHGFSLAAVFLFLNEAPSYVLIYWHRTLDILLGGKKNSVKDGNKAQ